MPSDRLLAHHQTLQSYPQTIAQVWLSFRGEPTFTCSHAIRTGLPARELAWSGSITHGFSERSTTWAVPPRKPGQSTEASNKRNSKP